MLIQKIGIVKLIPSPNIFLITLYFCLWRDDRWHRRELLVKDTYRKIVKVH